MPEAEDVITDAARHATVFARALWQRHRPRVANDSLFLADVAARLDLLTSAVFGLSARLRIAQPPPPPTFLGRLFTRAAGPQPRRAVPATDGTSIWLPRDAGARGPAEAQRYFRCMVLAQAGRLQRLTAERAATVDVALIRSVYLLLEAHVVDWELARSLPGLASELDAQRCEALAARPPLTRFPLPRQPLEQLARRLCGHSCRELPEELSNATAPAAVLQRARTLAARIAGGAPPGDHRYRGLLFLDDWTGDLRAPGASAGTDQLAGELEPSYPRRARSARLARRPEARRASEGEDDQQPGAWLIQTSQPHEQAEDALGLQRPTDRDEQTSPEEYADAISELTEARLVRTPGRAKEVLLGEDELDVPAGQGAGAGATQAVAELVYPEWDYRSQTYREPGARVRLLPAERGSLAWAERTLREHASMIETIRRRFQALRASRLRLRRQNDGDELDLDAYLEMHADLRGGRPANQAVYQTLRAARRDAAILLLVDVSGSTDGWVAANRRVIDVEREALLLVCSALQEIRDPLCVLAFSGESAASVTVRTLKEFAEPYSLDVAARIAALEPEAYTRAGAALRHASTMLMQQPARQRLLLLLSDGKPNDVDEYEGRYGIEDMQRAVVEAKLQGIHPFCLTVDRQAASYLSRIFGPGHYALLPQPELLPSALVGWLKHFITT